MRPSRTRKKIARSMSAANGDEDDAIEEQHQHRYHHQQCGDRVGDGEDLDGRQTAAGSGGGEIDRERSTVGGDDLYEIHV